MSKVLLMYWPEKGNVENVSAKIAEQMNDYEVEVKPITRITPQDLNDYDNWILGGSTVGSHVWMDADDSNRWHEYFKKLDTVNLNSKVVAFFGLGDQILYPHHFVDGLGVFDEEFGKRDAHVVGQWPTKGYNFYDSEGMKDDHFFGLALDEDQQPELTDERIARWLGMIKKDFK
jgi:flavodoxin I